MMTSRGGRNVLVWVVIFGDLGMVGFSVITGRTMEAVEWAFHGGLLVVMLGLIDRGYAESVLDRVTGALPWVKRQSDSHRPPPPGEA